MMTSSHAKPLFPKGSFCYQMQTAWEYLELHKRKSTSLKKAVLRPNPDWSAEILSRADAVKRRLPRTTGCLYIAILHRVGLPPPRDLQFCPSLRMVTPGEKCGSIGLSLSLKPLNNRPGLGSCRKLHMGR